MAHLLLRALDARIPGAAADLPPRPLEHDERIQLAHQVRSLAIQRDRAGPTGGLEAITAKLDPAARGSISLALR